MGVTLGITKSRRWWRCVCSHPCATIYAQRRDNLSCKAMRQRFGKTSLMSAHARRGHIVTSEHGSFEIVDPPVRARPFAPGDVGGGSLVTTLNPDYPLDPFRDRRSECGFAGRALRSLPNMRNQGLMRPCDQPPRSRGMSCARNRSRPCRAAARGN